jgi:hypothetical protein
MAYGKVLNDIDAMMVAKTPERQQTAPPVDKGKPLSQVTACVVDNGQFMEIARTLGKTYRKVYYYPAWESGFPDVNLGLLGKGWPEFELTDSPFTVFDECDLFVFPDVAHGPLQRHFEKLGKRVWGSRLAENLEMNRVNSKEIMEKKGLPVGPYVVIIGTEQLREYLKTHKNVVVKASKWRALFESFKVDKYTLVEPLIDKIALKLGVLKETFEFVVEQVLDDKVEIGMDGFTVDGQFPERMTYGIEVKGTGYLGMWERYERIPESITRYDRVMADVLEKSRYRGFYSTEVRIGKDRVPYMIDNCCRAGSPPSELYCDWYENMAEIVYRGAAGEMVLPKMKAKFGAEIMLWSSWAADNCLEVDFPNGMRDFIKIRKAVFEKGRWSIRPQSDKSESIGGVVGYGNTMKEAVDMALEIAECVKAYKLDYDKHTLEDVKEEIEKLQSFGLNVMNSRAG